MGLINSGTVSGGYSRLKGYLRSGINLAQVGKAVETAKNTAIGNLPKDLLDLIIKAHPERKGEMIKGAQAAFDNTAKILAGAENLQMQAIKRFTPTLENTVKLFEADMKCIEDKVFKEKMASYTALAEKTMLGDMQKILPELKDVKISFVGSGSYGQIYKCEFLDQRGEKLISDKAIKAFRTDENFSYNMIDSFSEVVNAHSPEEICEYAKRQGKELDKTQVSMAQGMYSAMSDAAKNISPEVIKSSERLHGPLAEANATEYLRYYSGHKLAPKDGIVIPDMIKLGNNPYQISEFVGEGTSAVRPFEFDRLGLMHTDIQNNPANLINGICVDLGGVIGEFSPEVIEKIGEGTSEASLDGIFKFASKTIGDKFLTGKLKRFMGFFNPEQKVQYLAELEHQAKTTGDMIKRSKLLSFITEMKNKMANNSLIN